MRTVAINEVFKSIQGEGKLIGYQQLFIRFKGCNLECTYCDTPHDAQLAQFKVYPEWGSGESFAVDNPVSSKRLAQLVQDLGLADVHSVSLTGGEPLLQADFLLEFLPALKEQAGDVEVKVFLETNGTLADELALVAPWIDHVSMDLKLPGYLKDETNLLAEHEAFLQVCLKHKLDTYVKLVVGNDFADQELAAYLDMLQRMAGQVVVYIQPMMAQNRMLLGQERMYQVFRGCIQRGLQVRMIPQVHKFLELI